MGLKEERDAATLIAVILGLVLLALGIWGLCVRRGEPCQWRDARNAIRMSLDPAANRTYVATLDASVVPYRELAPAFTAETVLVAEGSVNPNAEFLYAHSGDSYPVAFRVKGMPSANIEDVMEAALPDLRRALLLGSQSQSRIRFDPVLTNMVGTYEVDGKTYSYNATAPVVDFDMMSTMILLLLQRGNGDSFIAIAGELGHGDFSRLNQFACGTLSGVGALLHSRTGACRTVPADKLVPAWKYEPAAPSSDPRVRPN